MTHPLRALAAVLAAGATTLVAVGAASLPAHAEDQRVRDTTRDVRLIAADGSSPRPGNRAQDITRMTASYGGGELVLTLQVRELADDDQVVGWTVLTPTTRFLVVYERHAGSENLQLGTAADGPLPCAGLAGRASDSKDRLRVTVPRACLDRPRWIRFGGAAGGPADPADLSFVGDDGRGPRTLDPERFRVGSRVHYG